MKNRIKSLEAFEEHTERYEEWFAKNRFAYLSELEGVKSLLPAGKGIEIGVGTGRFAAPLGIKFGIDPSLSMLKVARERKIKVIGGIGEYLPIIGNSFDYVLITTTLCFLKNVEKTLEEIKRILRKNGVLILAFIDRESFLGKVYQKKKEKNPFYKNANFYSANEVIKKLKKSGFAKPTINQTLFTLPENLQKIDDIKDSYGKGGFVILRMRKNREV
ncbi:class I SAM-dependent methyltransferase [candidate division WOR-3 bacterium]|nr:class I SAM-dependent methyltransferase [candidate division WOR-3 bacterium]